MTPKIPSPFRTARLAVLAASFAALPAVAAPPKAEETLSPGSLLGATCASCHNTQGRSVQGTQVLAGIPREQFIAAFKEFAAGTRKATVMHRHAKGYTDQEIEWLADYFSTLKR